MAKRKAERLEPVHPGEILAEEMAARGLSSNVLGRELDIPANRISEIAAGRRSISADTAYRLGLYFKTSGKFWLNLQARYDLLRLERTAGKAIKSRVRPAAA